MLDSVKKAAGAVRNAGKRAAKKVLSTEPVVAINAVAAFALGVQQVAASELQPGDGWLAGAWVVVVYVIRRYVSPALARV